MCTDLAMIIKVLVVFFTVRIQTITIYVDILK